MDTPHGMEQIDAFIEKLYTAEGERVTRDELIGRAEQAGLPHKADRLFQDLPPGPYTKEQLRAIVHEWMANPGEPGGEQG